MKHLRDFLIESMVNEGNGLGFFNKFKQAIERYSNEIKISANLQSNLKDSKNKLLNALPNGSNNYDVLAIDKTMSKEFDKFWMNVIGNVEGDSWTEYYVLSKNDKRSILNAISKINLSRTFKSQFINADECTFETHFVCYKIDGKIESFGDSSWEIYPKISLFDVIDVRLNNEADVKCVIKALKENDSADDAHRIDYMIDELDKHI